MRAGHLNMDSDQSVGDRADELAEIPPRSSAMGVPSVFSFETRADDVDDDEGIVLCLVLILMVVTLRQLDGRLLCCPARQKVTVRSGFYTILRAQLRIASHFGAHQTLSTRCTRHWSLFIYAGMDCRARTRGSSSRLILQY